MQALTHVGDNTTREHPCKLYFPAHAGEKKLLHVHRFPGVGHIFPLFPLFASSLLR